jgi:MFS family permease
MSVYLPVFLILLISALIAALIISDVPRRYQGISLGFQGMSAGLGYMSGPILGGVLLNWLTWHSLFYARVPVHIIAIVLAIIFLPKDGHGLKIQVDVPGVLLTFLTAVSIMAAINQGGRLGWTRGVVGVWRVLGGGLDPPPPAAAAPAGAPARARPRPRRPRPPPRPRPRPPPPHEGADRR